MKRFTFTETLLYTEAMACRTEWIGTTVERTVIIDTQLGLSRAVVRSFNAFFNICCIFF